MQKATPEPEEEIQREIILPDAPPKSKKHSPMFDYRMRRIDENEYEVLYRDVQIDVIERGRLKHENKKEVQNLLKAKKQGFPVWKSSQFEVIYTKKEWVFDKVVVTFHNAREKQIRERMKDETTV